jgi:hypothetical protein
MMMKVRYLKVKGKPGVTLQYYDWWISEVWVDVPLVECDPGEDYEDAMTDPMRDGT